MEKKVCRLDGSLKSGSILSAFWGDSGGDEYCGLSECPKGWKLRCVSESSPPQ
jgi:hypothetical protein